MPGGACRSALRVSGAGRTLLGVSGRPGVLLETPAKNSKTSAGPTLPETLRHSGIPGVSRRSQNPLEPDLLETRNPEFSESPGDSEHLT